MNPKKGRLIKPTLRFWNIPCRKTGRPLQMFCSSWKFSNEVTQTLMLLFTWSQLEILEPESAQCKVFKLNLIWLWYWLFISGSLQLTRPKPPQVLLLPKNSRPKTNHLKLKMIPQLMWNQVNLVIKAKQLQRKLKRLQKKRTSQQILLQKKRTKIKEGKVEQAVCWCHQREHGYYSFRP